MRTADPAGGGHSAPVDARCRFPVSPFDIKNESPAALRPAPEGGFRGYSYIRFPETSMRVMVMVKATTESESGKMPKQDLIAAMMKFNEELINAGVMLAGEGLHPSVKGKRVRFSGTRRTVTDGPFAETEELVAGFWLWQVKSMEEAVEWVRRCPNPMESDSDIEIRPVLEAEDFGAELTPEVRAQEERLRAQTDGRK